MNYKQTVPAKRDVSTWPLGMRDILMERVQMEDQYRHRNDAPLPLPVRVSDIELTLTPAAAFAMGWDMIRSGVRTILP